MADSPLRLVGAPGSPYTRKMRALLRYRRIPFHFVVRNTKDDVGVPDVPVALIPVLVLPDPAGGEPEAMIDSTFQIGRLEALFPERSVVPADPALAFLDKLVEDYADEWLTKAMFHYRWAFQADIDKAAQVLPRWNAVNAPDEMIAKLSKVFAERQIGRLGVVGSNPTTGPFIEDSYERLLACLEAHLGNQPYVLGGRPGAGDFGLYGQLTQLAWFDPTPVAVTQRYPRVLAWMDLMEDLSGLGVEDGDWCDRDALPDTLAGLLSEIGRVYAPFLLGNAAALASGAEQVDCTIDGARWVQKPFPYQGKCLQWLREGHAALASDDRAFVDRVLDGTGCEALFPG
ncbi:MAG: glutathione S-transferase family protein [Myxococcota bacterium]